MSIQRFLIFILRHQGCASFEIVELCVRESGEDVRMGMVCPV